MGMHDDEWVKDAEPGWMLVQLPHRALGESFLLGDDKGRLTIRYFHKHDGSLLRAKILFGTGAQGPPGYAHGGSLAAVLDEGMGGAAWLSGHPVVAVELTTRFRRMLPLGSRCVLEAKVREVQGRKLRASGVLMDEAGEPYADAEGLFIELDEERLGMLRDKAMPLIEAARKRRGSIPPADSTDPREA